MKPPTLTGLQVAALTLLLQRLNDVRHACPGIGGDIDASNVRFMLEYNEWHQTTVRQAADTLRRLGASLEGYIGHPKYGDALEAVAALDTPPPAPKPVTTLEQRVAAIESRENTLARLFRELSQIELERNHRASIVRTMPPEHRSRISSLSGRTITSFSRPLLKDDLQYRSLVQQWEGVMASIRRIRSTPLSPVNA